MGHLAWTPDARQQLLTALRLRLTDEVLCESPSLAVTLGYLSDPLDDVSVRALREDIVRAIKRVQDEDRREALELMVGLHPATKSSRTTREQTLTQISLVLHRKTGPKRLQALPLGKRHVLNLEQTELVPAVIDAFEKKGGLDLFYGDAVVRIRLKPAGRTGRIRMEVLLEADYLGEGWLVGVTSDEMLADYVCGLSDAVNEMICPGPHEPTELPPNLRLSIRSRTEPQPKPRVINLNVAAVHQVAELVDAGWPEAIEDIKWFSASFPPCPEGTRISFMNEQLIRRAARYCYWSAGRRTYLRSITIDTSEFPNREQVQFCLQPFLSLPMTFSEKGDGFYELNIDEWLEPGNGVALIWGDVEGGAP